MKFCFDKPTCQNIRKSLRKEWLETNGLGDYASSSLICCNTRKYHGLLVTNLAHPYGRYVLLSTLEESLLVAGREFLFSSRKHPGTYYPKGHEYLHEMQIGEWPRFKYRFGDLRLTRELLLIPGKHMLVMKYSVRCDDTSCKLPPLTLRVKPLLAFRHFHQLTHTNLDLQVKTSPVPFGFKIQPYKALPPLIMQVQGKFSFFPSPDWYANVEYLAEQERGFPHQEDLFQPGVFDIEISPNKPVFLTASIDGVSGRNAKAIERLWEGECQRRLALAPAAESLEGHLTQEGEKFLIRTPAGDPEVLAGYHWFDAWGRDTLIALPGLTFCAGRVALGKEVLERMGKSAKNGLIPNCFGPDGNHSYNSVDASLWYVWAVQQLLHEVPNEEPFVRAICWPVIKGILDAYGEGRVAHVHKDAEGMLHVGSVHTQLTWMDATVNGKPVTPRYGCPVEINALWYNALAFSNHLAKRFDEPERRCREFLDAFRATFLKRFWVESGRYLADVWRENGIDTSVRPNQIFAVSLPYPVLDEEYQTEVIEIVRNVLLTRYGLRTLSPADPTYCPVYEGNPEARDSAYHQGTVWPWLLGAYGEALLRVAWDKQGAVRQLLDKLRPLFAQHLGDAGMGSISEIFDADPPHLPNGCIAQAWSVAECLRLLHMLEKAAPAVYATWEANARKGGK